MYLAVVLDLFSRKVVGWHLSDAPDTRLVLAALDQAATLRRIAPGSGLLVAAHETTQLAAPTRAANTPATPTKAGWRRWTSRPA